MNRDRRTAAFIGRVETFLIPQGRHGDPPIRASVVARHALGNAAGRVVCCGNLAPTQQDRSHVDATVIAVTRAIVAPLVPHLLTLPIELHLVLPDAAQAQSVPGTFDIQLVHAAAAMALLSFYLRIPISRHTAVVGEVTGADGQFVVPEGMHPYLRQFRSVCPTDVVVGTSGNDAPTGPATIASPCALVDQVIAADPCAPGLRTVADIEQLVRLLVPERSVLRAALSCGYFGRDSAASDPKTLCGRATRYLASDHDKRFWQYLERCGAGNEPRQAAAIMAARVKFHVRSGRYPADFGRTLERSIPLLPPATRDAILATLPPRSWLRLGQHAGPADLPDLARLLDVMTVERPSRPSTGEGPQGELSANARRILEETLPRIAPRELARTFSLPVSRARAAFVCNDITVSSYREFLSCLSSLHTTLVDAVRAGHTCPDDPLMQADCLTLLGEAFAEEGGVAAAWSEARTGIHGGVPFVIDRFAHQWAMNLQVKHVSRVLREAFNPLDWPERVAVMRCLMERLALHLDEDTDPTDAARFVDRLELFVGLYVQSLDSVQTRFRAL